MQTHSYVIGALRPTEISIKSDGDTGAIQANIAINKNEVD